MQQASQQAMNTSGGGGILGSISDRWDSEEFLVVGRRSGSQSGISVFLV